MRADINIGRFFGIRLGLHYSWLIIALLVTFSLAAQFSAVNTDWGTVTIWTTAVVTGLLFFTAIVLHEMAHAFVARLRGLPVRSITLFALGGVALIEKESGDAATEFWMGIAGPIMSVIIGIFCLLSAVALGWSPENQIFSPQTPPVAALVWLGYINIGLAVFNMLPGFPLDGGRVLRGIIWWATGNGDLATRVAARIGQFVAILFIGLGLFQFFAGGSFAGLWIALIGWFLLSAAGTSYAQNEISANLRGVEVRDVMRQDCEEVAGDLNLRIFVSDQMLKTGRRCFFVMTGERFLGIVTPREVAAVPPGEWQRKTVAEIMRPFDELEKVRPQTPVSDALEKMGRADVNQLPVIEPDGNLAGVISRQHILEALRIRRELAV
jgi:Zn-dependent protease/CBS domain-containing protein